MTTRPDITITRPHITNGPVGVPEDTADVDYLRKAADDLERYVKPFGSTLRATIVKLIRDTAGAIETQSSGTEDSVELACAWSDYRADYDIPGGVDPATAHRLFKAGWAAHRDGDTRGPMR